MNGGKVNELLIPNVSKLPSQKRVNQNGNLPRQGVPSEFESLLNERMDGAQAPKEGISLSTHAAKRLQERNLSIDSNEYMKLKSAFEKLKSKGGQDSLVITDKAAYIVDVPKNRIVTAMDKGSVLDNVFTKIDSTVIV